MRSVCSLLCLVALLCGCSEDGDPGAGGGLAAGAGSQAPPAPVSGGSGAPAGAPPPAAGLGGAAAPVAGTSAAPGPAAADATPPATGPDAATGDGLADAATPAVDAGAPDAGGAASALCEPGPGSITVDATIVVGPGELFDGSCQRYVAGPAVGDGSQSESQDPVFRLEDGARLVNVVLGFPAADGIHTHGDVTLENITWEDIGEDALTIKDSGSVELDRGAAYDGEDKVFQINAASTFRVSNFRADNAGKFIRQNGGTTFRVDVTIDACDISNMDEAIFRTDSSVSTVTMTNTRYSSIGNSGDALWYGVNPANITESGNTEY